jgi:3-hydroxyacyl-CoA dehydrogenase
MNEIRRVGIVGGGLMGSGKHRSRRWLILNYIVSDVSDALCDKAMANIRSLAQGVEAGKITIEA